MTFSYQYEGGQKSTSTRLCPQFFLNCGQEKGLPSVTLSIATNQGANLQEITIYLQDTTQGKEPKLKHMEETTHMNESKSFGKPTVRVWNHSIQFSFLHGTCL